MLCVRVGWSKFIRIVPGLESSLVVTRASQIGASVRVGDAGQSKVGEG